MNVTYPNLNHKRRVETMKEFWEGSDAADFERPFGVRQLVGSLVFHQTGDQSAHPKVAV